LDRAAAEGAEQRDGGAPADGELVGHTGLAGDAQAPAVDGAQLGNGRATADAGGGPGAVAAQPRRVGGWGEPGVLRVDRGALNLVHLPREQVPPSLGAVAGGAVGE